MIYVYSLQAVISQGLPGKGSAEDPISSVTAGLMVKARQGLRSGIMGKVGRIQVVSLLSLIAISYVNGNSIPEISTEVVQLREDIPIGGYAFTILATDHDGDKLSYGMTGPNTFYFNVDKDTGEVTVKSQLDRENQELIEVTVTVTDHIYPDVSASIFIVVEDANDNRPEFIGIPYSTVVPETTPPGESIFQVTAIDKDIGMAGVVNYAISEVIPSDDPSMFSIDKNGIIMLTGELSYTDKSYFYQLTINASDNGGPLGDNPNYVQSNLAFLSVNIKDVANLDPQFLNLPGTASVEEGTPLGTSVFQVRARDPDTGINDKILYSITTSSVPDLFQIIESSGIISVKSDIDREALLENSMNDAVVVLQIEAKESLLDINGVQAKTTDQIQIIIRDINDNKPVFLDCSDTDCVEQDSFQGEIDEHSSVGLPVQGLNVHVQDLDKMENGTFLLSLEGPDKGAFSISPSSALTQTQIQILVKNPEEVDYEKYKTMTVQVVALDSLNEAFRSTATVTITINDINDNRPTFENDTYTEMVKEHSPVGTLIATITATDLDTEDAGNIEYKLLPESLHSRFNVDPKTGGITVQSSELLDREVRSSYSATLQARDKANNIGSTILEIVLLDINDHAPKMIRPFYEFYVNENVNGLMFEVQASDNDEPDTVNSKIQYEIVDSEFQKNFTIDRDTGKIETNGILDREAIDIELKGQIELNVTAYDMGEPRKSTWAMVLIEVQDVNDNDPHFRQSEYNFTVKESEKNAFVGSVWADDADQTYTNNRISFDLGGNLGNFFIRSFQATNGKGFSGNISVDADTELDYDHGRRSYTFTVTATDVDGRKATTTANVKVLDVNDETPMLNDTKFHVKENTTITGDVGKLEGKDLDTNHSLTYKLVSSECESTKILEPCEEEWFIVEPTGDVKVNPEFVIDYEAHPLVVLNVAITDIYTEKGEDSSIGKVIFEIEDINDNAPEFYHAQPNFVVLAESTKKDTSVAHVYARDRDTLPNAEMVFSVQSVKFVHTNNQTEDLITNFYADVPQIEPCCNAVIRSLETLDVERKGRYVLTVKAGNAAAPQLSSATEITIFTVDKSYRVSLEFRTTVQDFKVNEEQIKINLELATRTIVHIMDVKAKRSEKRAEDSVTVVEAYFIYSNGTALSYDAVLNIVNRNEEYRDILFEYGLTGVHSGGSDGNTEDNLGFFVMVGLVGALVITLVVTSTSLVCIKRNYKRKLKAAKAMNSAAMTANENQKSGPVVPGTNKYTMEGANPVLNLNIDTATDLGFDEDGSNTDRAR
ncbi:cadherin-related family member 2 isoform X2 [Denticeps clupeoides]|uniref:cadherin-related family member 2 isoform X2 n=1 Tax=Denticeps clupeoides TaxID=299321 RepID=UPI0010A4154F|nr:cadherin-related family member 2-like isoform X2 [Denticeps clupeoides]